MSALVKVGLYEKMDEPMKNLSGGMKRRLSLAMSLIGNPDILFLDEPTSGIFFRFFKSDIFNLLKMYKY